MKTFREFINEAAVGGKNIQKASGLIARYFSTQSGTNFKFFDDIEVSRDDGDFIQSVFVNVDGTEAFGINWDNGDCKTIVFWDNYKIGANPQREVIINANAGSESFATFLPRAIRMLYGEDVGGKKDESTKADKATLTEAQLEMEIDGEVYTGKKAIALTLLDKGKTPKEISKIIKISAPEIERWKAEADNNSLESDDFDGIKLRKAPAQVNKFSKQDNVAKKQFDDVEYADPKVVFNDMEDLTRMVAAGVQTALLVTGSGGTGKSFTIEKVLKETGTKGEDYVIMKGHCTPIAMYRFLYNHYNQICMFDDCDSIFDTPDGLNILKGALDSNEVRKISWQSQNTIPTEGLSHDEIEAELAAAQGTNGKTVIPSEFEFEGAVIFVSNRTRKDIAKKDAALLTRCACIDITLKQSDIILRIETVLPHLRVFKAISAGGESKEITNDEMKKAVMEFCKTEEFQKTVQSMGADVTFRTFINLCKAWYVFANSANPERWKEVGLYMV